MGPRSDNRGYAFDRRNGDVRSCALQWVHGPITVVMADDAAGHRCIAITSFNGSTVR